ncbi:hypothetical protein PAE4_30497 [Bacillus altitudinis]|nr:hypothetical protein PAE4_30497 [Bacillus altitudinis]
MRMLNKKALLERFFSFITTLAAVLTAFYIIVTPYLIMVCHHLVGKPIYGVFYYYFYSFSFLKITN